MTYGSDFMGAITNDWLEVLNPQFGMPYYKKLYDTVKREYSTHVVYPPADDILNALNFTPLSKVKVVIIGQDPYHEPGQAHGLCFSVKKDIDIPPSLVNIYKELQEDLGCYIPNNGYLKKWADQGVLMLNTVLTVRAGVANSHKGIGWEQFTDAIISAVNNVDRPVVYLLWGRPARMKEECLTIQSILFWNLPIQVHCLLTEVFLDVSILVKPMSSLVANGLTPIDWQIENV